MTQIPRMTKEQRDELLRIPNGSMRALNFEDRAEIQVYKDGIWEIAHKFTNPIEDNSEL